MTTPLTKPVTRETATVHRGRKLVVRMTAQGIYTKGTGQRWTSAYFVPWAAVDDLGARLVATQMTHSTEAQ